MQQVFTSPEVRQVPGQLIAFPAPAGAVREGRIGVYDVASSDGRHQWVTDPTVRDEGPPTVSAPAPVASVRDVVFDRLGWQARGFYESMLTLEDRGHRLSYGVIEMGLGVSRSVVMRMCRKLVEVGAITIDRTTGGRGKESAINCVRNCVYNYVSTDTVTPETVSETVSGPPYIPPVVNVVTTTKKKDTPLPPQNADDGFEAFWTAYPRKVAKADALKAWRKVKPDAATKERILAALSLQAVSFDWVKEGGRFIPHPATWLNGHRWEDEVSSAPPMTNGNGHAPLPDLDSAVEVVNARRWVERKMAESRQYNGDKTPASVEFECRQAIELARQAAMQRLAVR